MTSSFINTNTECAVGGQNCGQIDKKVNVQMASLAFDIFTICFSNRKRKAMVKIIKNDLQQLVTVSTYNFRTALGYGMPSIRKKRARMAIYV